MEKLIALPVFQDRISPLFDVAKRYAVYELSDKEIKQKMIIDIQAESEFSRIDKLKDIGVSGIICGAVSAYMSGIVTQKGIELIPWACGFVDDVIKLYIDGSLETGMAPGCKRGIMKGQCGKSGKRGKCNNKIKNINSSNTGD